MYFFFVLFGGFFFVGSVMVSLVCGVFNKNIKCGEDGVCYEDNVYWCFI